MRVNKNFKYAWPKEIIGTIKIDISSNIMSVVEEDSIMDEMILRVNGSSQGWNFGKLLIKSEGI